MAKAPNVANGIDIDSDAPPPGGDTALVGDAGGDGHIIVEEGEEEADNWDVQPDGKPKKPTERKTTDSDDDGEYDEEDSRLAYSDSDDLPPGHAEREARGTRARRNARRSRQKQAADSEIMALREALAQQGQVLRGLVNGQSSMAANTVAGGGVAYWAHVGGFAAGLLLIKVFATRRSSAADAPRSPAY